MYKCKSRSIGPPRHILSGVDQLLNHHNHCHQTKRNADVEQDRQHLLGSLPVACQPIIGITDLEWLHDGRPKEGCEQSGNHAEVDPGTPLVIQPLACFFLGGGVG